MTRNTMILHREWSCFLNFLSDEELGIWLRSLLRLMETGEFPTNLDRPVEVAFFAAYERIDRDWQKLDKRLANLVQNRKKEEPQPAEPPAPPQPQKQQPQADTQPPLLEQMVKECSAAFDQPPQILRRELSRALARFGPELTRAILDNCLSHHPKSWAYLRRAFLNASQLGLSSAQDYQISCLRASGQVVDRASPSKTDILTRALHRPPKLKRPA